MDSKKHGRFEEIIRDLAARFILIESTGGGLITVTKIESTDKGEMVTVFVSVFPESFEKEALEFLKRKRSDFRFFVGENSKLFRVPFFEFAIDKGEKNRIRVEEASKNK